MDLLSGLGGWGNQLPPVAGQADQSATTTDEQEHDSVAVQPPETVDSSPAQVTSHAIVPVGRLFEDLGKRAQNEKNERQRIAKEVVSSGALANRDQTFTDSEAEYTKQIGQKIVQELKRSFEARLDQERQRIRAAEKELEKLVGLGVRQVNKDARRDCIKQLSSESFEFSHSVVVEQVDLKEMEQVKRILAAASTFEGAAQAAVLQTLDAAIQGVAKRVCLSLAKVLDEAVEDFSQMGRFVWEISKYEEGGAALGKTWERDHAGVKLENRPDKDLPHWILKEVKAAQEAYSEDAKYEYTTEPTKGADNQQTSRDLRDPARLITVTAILTLNIRPNMDLVDQVWPEANAPAARASAPSSDLSQLGAQAAPQVTHVNTTGGLDVQHDHNKMDVGGKKRGLTLRNLFRRGGSK